MNPPYDYFVKKLYHNFQGVTNMLLLSWNVNGLRSVLSKDLLNLIPDWNADAICLQETKARANQVDVDWAAFGYYAFWAEAVKPGYSGVLTLVRKKPLNVWHLNVSEFDSEGRVLGLDFDEFSLVNTYFPNSQEGGARLDYKLAFCQAIEEKLNNLKKIQKNVVLCGDLNIAHQPIDLTNPKQNEKNPGYLPEERAWMSSFLSHGWKDSFRELYPETVKYSWWSYRFNARQKNIGWRIDYFCVNQEAFSRVQDSRIWDQVYGSDHCPVVLDLTANR